MPPRVRAEIQFVCALYQVPEADLLGRARNKRLWEARRHCWTLLRALRTPLGQPFSYPQIAHWFDRDHTTIMLGVRAYCGRSRSLAQAA